MTDVSFAIIRFTVGLSRDELIAVLRVSIATSYMIEINVTPSAMVPSCAG